MLCLLDVCCKIRCGINNIGCIYSVFSEVSVEITARLVFVMFGVRTVCMYVDCMYVFGYVVCSEESLYVILCTVESVFKSV